MKLFQFLIFAVGRKDGRYILNFFFTNLDEDEPTGRNGVPLPNDEIQVIVIYLSLGRRKLRNDHDDLHRKLKWDGYRVHYVQIPFHPLPSP